MRDLLDEFKRMRTDEERLAWYTGLTAEEQQALCLQVQAVTSYITDTLLPELEAMSVHFRAMLEPWSHAARLFAEAKVQLSEPAEPSLAGKE